MYLIMLFNNDTPFVNNSGDTLFIIFFYSNLILAFDFAIRPNPGIFRIAILCVLILLNLGSMAKRGVI